MLRESKPRTTPGFAKAVLCGMDSVGSREGSATVDRVVLIE